MASAIETKVQELVAQHGYDAQILLQFVEFIQSQPKPRKHTSKSSEKRPTSKTTTSKKALTLNELQVAVATAFNCIDVKELKKQEAFKIATDGRELNFRTKEAWLVLYREWVGVPENERHEEGPNCINGVDILKNFRPWHVFGLNSKTATTDDINAAFRRLAKQYHPDVGGNNQVFEQLQKMRDSILAFRQNR
jgi:DnaJ domain